MNNTRKIVEFSEGILSEAEEKQLLIEMISSTELRSSFRNLMNFDKTLKSETRRLKPSKDLRAAVFAGTGFMDTDDAGLSAKSFEKSIHGRKSNFFSIAGASVLSSLLTALLITQIFTPGGTGETTPLSMQNRTSVESVFDDSLKMIEDEQYTQKNGGRKHYLSKKNALVNEPEPELNCRIRAESADVPINGSEEIREPVLEINRSAFGNDILSYSFADDRKQTDGLSFIYRNVEKASEKQARFLKEKNKSDFFSRLSVEFSGFENLYFTEEKVPANGIPVFANKNAGVFYDFNENFSFGLSAKNETFYLKYDFNENNAEFLVEQQPNLFSGEFGLIWRPLGNEGIKPFMRGCLGWSRMGPLARSAVGMSFPVGRAFSVFAGMEYAALFYENRGRLFTASKLNIHYGIKYFINH